MSADSVADRLPAVVDPPPSGIEIRQRVLAYYNAATTDYRAWSREFNMHFGYWRFGLNPFRREPMLHELNLQALARLNLPRDRPARSPTSAAAPGRRRARRRRRSPAQRRRRHAGAEAGRARPRRQRRSAARRCDHDALRRTTRPRACRRRASTRSARSRAPAMAKARPRRCSCAKRIACCARTGPSSWSTRCCSTSCRRAACWRGSPA